MAGVGKNFSLAQLASEFFLPYNIIAIPLDAGHSLHGSLGVIERNDVLLASSKSGNTQELLLMILALNKKFISFDNSYLITSNKHGIVNEHFKNVYVASSSEEKSLYGFSPQDTIMQYLKIYFDILNVLNISSKCTICDYLVNHQGGTIGRNK